MPWGLKTSLPILHRLAQDAREVLLRYLLRRADEQALLLHRALHEVVYVVLGVAELSYAARGADVFHEVYEDLGQRVLVGVAYGSPVQQFRDLLVALRHGVVGEAEGRRGRDYDGPAVRDEGVVRRGAGRLAAVLGTGDGGGGGGRGGGRAGAAAAPGGRHASWGPARGWAQACGMGTPAEPKPTPASDAPSII